MQERSPADIMNRAPRVARAGTLASAALEAMNRTKITVLFIVDDDKPVGVLHIHDLLRAGVA
jgi:arabinose-5-phosphate isomerase